ncbi:MAG: primosomal protein N', partial [Chloroflexi bacterium]|nr:primosomal protein N' [Chloroflexota bacterium]
LMEARFAHVALQVGGQGLDYPLTYRVPDDMKPEVGMCAVVPIQMRQELGYILAITPTQELPADLKPDELRPPYMGEIKPLASLLDAPPMFDRATAGLFCWMAREYACGISAALRCVVPPYRMASVRTLVKLSPENVPVARDLRSPVAARLYETLAAAGGEADLRQLQQAVGSRGLQGVIRRLASQGKLEVVRSVQAPPEERAVTGLRLNVAAADLEAWFAQDRRPARQEAVLRFLAESGDDPVTQADLMRKLRCSASPIKTLLDKGMIERVSLQMRRNPWPEKAQVDLELHLTHDQGTAVEVILGAVSRSASRQAARDRQGIEETRRLGRQSLALVPEISLTAQMLQIFFRRFGSRVAVLHSKLSDGERLDEWQRIRRGEVDVVIGARSALFAPVPRLGLIVLDEEHETSYKQDSNPRYLARDTAMERARRCGACVVLASATPSMETAWLASQGAAREVYLPTRIDNRPLPVVSLVDQRQELKENPGRLFSRRLEAAIADRLERGEQTILFLNRRGFATITLCRECGYVARCRNCEVSLTYYDSTRLLRCHHCQFARPAPDVCPVCKGTRIMQFGLGTEKVERELVELFPRARLSRMDTDSVSRKGSAQEIVDRFGRNEIDILVGTQMVAKGFHFPGVTLVGVVSADTMLNIPDFRAAERTFQLLTQVSGRAGRGELAGEVIVQSFSPEHYAIQAAAEHDFDRFYRDELEIRRQARYPPFVRIANIVVEDRSQAHAQSRAERVAGALRSIVGSREIDILGPAPAPLVRLHSHFRWHILLKAADRSELRDVCRSLRFALRGDDALHAQVDIDAMSLL